LIERFFNKIKLPSRRDPMSQARGQLPGLRQARIHSHLAAYPTVHGPWLARFAVTCKPAIATDAIEIATSVATS
jgi:hypothetical protein